jgi:formylglycine-generating enzyme required for sulfatase activity
LILKTDGKLWVTGRNNYGQLCDGSTNGRSSLVQVASNIQAVFAGMYHSMLLKTDGSLWVVGLNLDGQLGDGTTVNRPSIKQILSPTTTTTSTTLPPVTTTTTIPLLVEMVEVEGGTFQMGSIGGNADELPVHSVTLSPFNISKYEITQSQYMTVVGRNPSVHSTYADSASCPVEWVTWFEAVEFCNQVSERYGFEKVYTITNRNPATGYPITNATVIPNWENNGFRLPTEAEWEYSARAGATTNYYWGIASDNTTIGRYAWFDNNSGNRTRPVGQKLPNAWGLYDMVGNVFEMCWDWYGNYTNQVMTDPYGSTTGVSRIIRGGCYAFPSSFLRLANRGSYGHDAIRGANTGFRVVRHATPPITTTTTTTTTLPPAFTVAYHGNGSTSESVPLDSLYYFAGTSVTVLENTGSLARTGYSFTGWNTTSSGIGSGIKRNIY